MIGRVIGPYRVEAELGAGASARVFRVVHRALKKSFALKLFSTKVGVEVVERERFHREATALAEIAHPNVVHLTDFGVTEVGQPYLVMEWVEGRSLLEEMKDGIATDRIVTLAAQIAEGLAAVHQAGIIHRDLKPANIMVLSADRPKIVDFGLVRSDSDKFPALTRPDAILGTPYYMSPEQILCEGVSDQSDLYSLGAILYEMLTRRYAFAGAGVIQILEAQLGPRPPKLAPRYGELGALIDELLCKDPWDRPPNARAVVERMRRIARDFAATPEALIAIPPADTRLVPAPRTPDELTRVRPGDLTESDAGEAATPVKVSARKRPGVIIALAASLGVAVLIGRLTTEAPRDPMLPVSRGLPKATEAPAPVAFEAPPAPAVPTAAPRPVPAPLARPPANEAPKARRGKRTPPLDSLEPGTPVVSPAPVPPPAPHDPPKVVLERLGRLIRTGGRRLSADDDARYFDLRERVGRGPPSDQDQVLDDLRAFERELLARPMR